MSRAIAYLDGFPWLSCDRERIGNMICNIENLYRDLIETETIPIKDEEGNVLYTLLPKKAKHDPCKNLYAEEDAPYNSTQTIYLDQFGFITNVL